MFLVEYQINPADRVFVSIQIYDLWSNAMTAIAVHKFLTSTRTKLRFRGVHFADIMLTTVSD